MNKWNKANKTILFGVLMPPAIFFTYEGTCACFKPPSLNTSLNIEGVSLIHSHFEDFEAVLPDHSPDLPEGSPYQNEIGIESSVAISGSTVIATINIGPLGPVNTSPFSPINIDPFDLQDSPPPYFKGYPAINTEDFTYPLLSVNGRPPSPPFHSYRATNQPRPLTARNYTLHAHKKRGRKP